eukprot:TRINITY_DN7350_c0_g1_i1.p1 TRINITY_DN7350_c0_g1~~TRINITY_DN7350_c0_g1_i1.p1  ORF type:complete len:135 (-),score=20.93 TRINITY_DN7350_c0_g1_i1:249-653(-)
MGHHWLLWLVVVVVCAVLFIASVFFIAEILELEQDYTNPIDLCRRLNPFIVPNIIAHVFVTLAFATHPSLIGLFLNLPTLIYSILRWKDNKHLLDSTTICKSSKEYRVLYCFYLVSYVLSFAFAVYNMFVAMRL